MQKQVQKTNSTCIKTNDKKIKNIREIAILMYQKYLCELIKSKEILDFTSENFKMNIASDANKNITQVIVIGVKYKKEEEFTK